MRRKKIFNIPPVQLLAAFTLFAFTGYVCYLWQASYKSLIPLSVAALLLGAFFESKRISDTWSTIFYSALGALALSFLVFLPYKNEITYNLDNHLKIWPYGFLAGYIGIIIFLQEHRVIPQLTEGITLMQSMALFYWVIDEHIYETTGPFITPFIVTGILFSLFAVFNAFTHFAINELSRLILSLWSSIMMVLFAADCILRVLSNGEIETAQSFNNGLYIALQYFLLGISSIYMAHNLYMLLGFLPSRGKPWTDIGDLFEKHVKRYSANQVSVWQSLLCVLLTGSFFYLNSYYRWLPRHLAIWLAFVIFPFIVLLFDNSTNKQPGS